MREQILYVTPQEYGDLMRANDKAHRGYRHFDEVAFLEAVDRLFGVALRHRLMYQSNTIRVVNQVDPNQRLMVTEDNNA